MNCPVCRAIETSPFMDYRGCHLVRCDYCRLVFMDPPPGASAVKASYADPYQGASTGYFKKAKIKIRNSRICINRIIRLFGLNPSGLHFLDVGCTGGFMTEAARERGFIATGIDPDGPGIAYARRHYPGNVFRQGFLEDLDFPPQSFDLVSCSEVIEHCRDVNLFMSRLAAVMKPGGILYLTTPDIEHWRRPRDITRWDAFCPPSHCLYFNKENLAQLLSRHGLAVERRRIALKPGIRLFARRVDGAFENTARAAGADSFTTY